MTARLCTPSFHPHPLSTHFKSAHRARAGRPHRPRQPRGARGRPGARCAGGTRSRSSTSRCARSSTACASTSRSSSRSSGTPRRGSPGTWPRPTRRTARGRLDAFYAPLVVDDEALEAGLADGTLRDRHPAARHAPHASGSARRTGRRPGIGVRRGSAVEDAALFAAEYTALGEADLGASLRRPGRRRWRRGSAGSSGAPRRASAASPEACARERAPGAAPGVRPDEAGRRSSSSCSLSPSSGSRRSAGRWRRGGTRGTTSSTTSSSSTPTRRSRRCSSSARRSRRSSSGCRWISAGASCSRSSSACSSRSRSSPGARRRSPSGAFPRSRPPCCSSCIPAWATLYHQASSDAVFATGLALWALVLARALRRPTTRRLRRARRRHRGARPDPAGEPGAAPGGRSCRCWRSLPGGGGSPGLRPASRRRRCRSRAGPCTTASATTTSPSRAAVAPGCRSCASSRDDRTIAPENGAASRRLAELVEDEVLDRGAVTRASGCRSTRTSRTGRTTRPSG